MVRNSYPKIVCSFCFPQQKSNFELSKFTSLKAFYIINLDQNNSTNSISTVHPLATIPAHTFCTSLGGGLTCLYSEKMKNYWETKQNSDHNWWFSWLWPSWLFLKKMVMMHGGGSNIVLLRKSHVSIIQLTYSAGLVPRRCSRRAWRRCRNRCRCRCRYRSYWCPRGLGHLLLNLPTRRVYQDTRTFYLWWVSCGFISAPKAFSKSAILVDSTHLSLTTMLFWTVHLKSTPLLKLKFSQTHNYLTRMAFNFGYFKIAWLETSPPFSW